MAHSRNYFNEIKTPAIHENLDPRNISAIQYIRIRIQAQKNIGTIYRDYFAGKSF